VAEEEEEIGGTMMHLCARLQYGVVILIGIALMMASCDQRRRSSIPPLNNSKSSEAVFIDQPVSFCWQGPLQPKKGRVQILIDASGSMVGFQQSIPSLVGWVRHAISQLQGSTLVVDSFRLCQFRQEGAGIMNCTGFHEDMAAYRPRGDTNLHDAVRSAKEYELTFILTDGVAATGTRGSGDCAAGVDAACVARALREAIHAQAHEGGDVDRGLWIIPLLAIYDGTFYTEEPILPADFRPDQTIQQIRADIGVQAVIQNPRTGPDGRLVFGYKGPRAMLLIVMARWADVGRAAVQALWERAEFFGVRRLEQAKGFSSGLASLPPVEVYPGFLNPIQWKSLEEPQDPTETRGTMDAFFQTDSAKSVISVDCPQRGSGEGVYRLIGSPIVTQVSGCVPIRLLPAFSFRFRTVHPEDESALSQLLKGYERQGNSYTDLRVHLACSRPASIPRSCTENPIAVQWKTYIDYGKAADCLASSNCAYAGHQLIKTLSTARPSFEPHRIFAFSTTLELFYREVAQDRRSIVLANLDICYK
jgi:hypothetical protein